MKMLPDTTAIQVTVKGAAASGSAITTTISGVSGEYIVIDSVFWSYDGNPTNGLLTIASTGMDTLSLHVTVGGPGQIVFPNSGLKLPVGKDATIILADGTAAKHMYVVYR